VRRGGGVRLPKGRRECRRGQRSMTLPLALHCVCAPFLCLPLGGVRCARNVKAHGPRIYQYVL
jgi:hypothetical protein